VAVAAVGVVGPIAMECYSSLASICST
jgi:hypothetical protein